MSHVKFRGSLRSGTCKKMFRYFFTLAPLTFPDMNWVKLESSNLDFALRVFGLVSREQVTKETHYFEF